MKKYLLITIFFLISANFIFASPFEIFNFSDTVRAELYYDEENELVGEEMEAYAQIRNVSSSDVEFSITMTFLEITSGHSGALCWGECFAFTDQKFVSPWNFTLKAGEASKVAQFSGHILPYKLLSENPLLYSKAVAGVTRVRYSFEPVGGTEEDKLHYDVVFIVDAPASVASEPTILDNGIYPIPANDFINVDLAESFSNDTFAVINDINGNKVTEYKISAGTNNLRVDVGALANGTYFIEIRNGSKLSIKKFVVSK